MGGSLGVLLRFCCRSWSVTRRSRVVLFAFIGGSLGVARGSRAFKVVHSAFTGRSLTTTSLVLDFQGMAHRPPKRPCWITADVLLAHQVVQVNHKMVLLD